MDTDGEDVPLTATEDEADDEYDDSEYTSEDLDEDKLNVGAQNCAESEGCVAMGGEGTPFAEEKVDEEEVFPRYRRKARYRVASDSSEDDVDVNQKRASGSKRALDSILDTDEEENARARVQRQRHLSPSPTSDDDLAPEVGRYMFRYVYTFLLYVPAYLIKLLRATPSLPSSPASLSALAPSLANQELLETPILKRLQLKIHKDHSLIICTLCESGVLLSQVWKHVKDAVFKINAHGAGPGHPTTLLTSRIGIPHGMMLEDKKKQLPKDIAKEVEIVLGITNIWDWTSLKKRTDDPLWIASACPSASQPRPIEGVRKFIGVICNLCPGPNPACGLTWGSHKQHRKLFHKDQRGVAVEDAAHEGLIQSKCLLSSYTYYFPVPGALPVLPTLVSGDSQATLPEIEGTSDAAWDAILDKQQSTLLLNSTNTATLVDVLNEKTLPPFYRDYKIHPFLSKHPHKECLALCNTSVRRGSAAIPREIRRLSAAVASTFLEDCEMVSNLSPAIRRTIAQCDP